MPDNISDQKWKSNSFFIGNACNNSAPSIPSPQYTKCTSPNTAPLIYTFHLNGENRRRRLMFGPSSSLAEEKMICSNCGTTSSSYWRRSPTGERICNACGLYYRSKKKSRPIKLIMASRKKSDPNTRDMSASETPSFANTTAPISLETFLPTPPSEPCGSPTQVISVSTRCCIECGTTSTSLWRRNHEGFTVCNACGLHLKSKRQKLNDQLTSFPKNPENNSTYLHKSNDGVGSEMISIPSKPEDIHHHPAFGWPNSFILNLPSKDPTNSFSPLPSPHFSSPSLASSYPSSILSPTASSSSSSYASSPSPSTMTTLNNSNYKLHPYLTGKIPNPDFLHLPQPPRTGNDFDIDLLHVSVSPTFNSPYNNAKLEFEDISSKSIENMPLFGGPLSFMIEDKSSEALASLFAYCFSSILMTLTNKYVLSSHDFHLYFFLLAVQSGICVLCLRLFKMLGMLNFRELRKKETIAWFPISLLLVAMIYTGSRSIKYLTISMFTIFKNVTIILIAWGDFKFFNGRINGMMLLSFFLIIMSSVIGGYSDIMFDFVGYAWMMLNCFCSATYVLGMRGSIKKVEFRDFDTVYYNNTIGFVIMMILTVVTEDWNDFFSKYFNDGPLSDQKSFLFGGIIISSFSAFAISYSSAWAVRVVSSTTYSMVGALNKLPVAISGILFFKDERHVSAGNILSIAIAFLSGIVYTKAQLDLKKTPPVIINEKSSPV